MHNYLLHVLWMKRNIKGRMPEDFLLISQPKPNCLQSAIQSRSDFDSVLSVTASNWYQR